MDHCNLRNKFCAFFFQLVEAFVIHLRAMQIGVEEYYQKLLLGENWCVIRVPAFCSNIDFFKISFHFVCRVPLQVKVFEQFYREILGVINDQWHSISYTFELQRSYKKDKALVLKKNGIFRTFPVSSVLNCSVSSSKNKHHGHLTG